MARSRFRSIAVATLAVLLVAPAVQALVTPTKVLGGPEDQWEPFANDEWLTFTTYGKTYSVQAMKRATGFTFRMNEAGTRGSNGGLDPDENVAVYQQYTSRTSAIYLYDLDARTRRLAPGVNSPAWEWDPRISDRYISFFRNREAGGVDYIDLCSSGAIRGSRGRSPPSSARRSRSRTTSTCGTAPWAIATSRGAVGQRRVTLVMSSSTTPSRDHEADHRRGDRVEYGGVVDEGERVRVLRPVGERLRASTAIWRIAGSTALGSTPTKVADLPDGFDAGWEASIAVNGEHRRDRLLLRARLVRTEWNGDVYVAAGVDTA